MLKRFASKPAIFVSAFIAGIAIASVGIARAVEASPSDPTPLPSISFSPVDTVTPILDPSPVVDPTTSATLPALPTFQTDDDSDDQSDDSGDDQGEDDSYSGSGDSGDHGDDSGDDSGDDD